MAKFRDDRGCGLDQSQPLLGLITKALLVAIRLHALTTFMLTDFCLTDFFQVTHNVVFG